ncbi:hypothetical protein VNO77_15582 [Canavalia gladiata]|uniref:Uncharacterized protein n=1 Tax=Canavalia gladiata TaxID=3824 RepID=A0AAN9QVX5_CANGL
MVEAGEEFSDHLLSISPENIFKLASHEVAHGILVESNDHLDYGIRIICDFQRYYLLTSAPENSRLRVAINLRTLLVGTLGAYVDNLVTEHDIVSCSCNFEVMIQDGKGLDQGFYVELEPPGLGYTYGLAKGCETNAVHSN